MAEQNPMNVEVKRIIADHPLYRLVELESGQRMVVVNEDGPMATYANIQSTQMMHPKVDVLSKTSALSDFEAHLLHESLTAYRNRLFDRLIEMAPVHGRALGS